MQEVQQFFAWFKSLPHPHKVLVAGNHEISFDASKTEGKRFDFVNDVINDARASGVLYLQDETALVAGLRIFGSEIIFPFWNAL